MDKNYLPEENISHAPKRNVRDVLVISALIFFLLNFIAFIYLRDSHPNQGSRIVAEKWKLLENLPESDWLILGDSSCNQGIKPELFESSFGGQAYNLCTIANFLTVGDAWMLDYYLKKHQPPKNILIVHVYDIWHRENLNVSVTAQAPINTILFENLEPTGSITFWDVAGLYLNKYIPLYYQNISLKTAIINFFKGVETQKFVFDSHGFMFDWKADPKFVQDEAKDHLKYVESHKFYISERNREGFETIKRLALENNLKVYFATSPMYEGVYNDQNFREFFSGEINYFHKNFCDNENIYCIDEVITFSKEEMANIDHVISPAAEIYTIKLIEKIKQANFH